MLGLSSYIEIHVYRRLYFTKKRKATHSDNTTVHFYKFYQDFISALNFVCTYAGKQLRNHAAGGRILMCTHAVETWQYTHTYSDVYRVETRQYTQCNDHDIYPDPV